MPRSFPIVQFPKRSLIATVLAAVIACGTRGRTSSAARLVSRLSLFVWSAEEISMAPTGFAGCSGRAARHGESLTSRVGAAAIDDATAPCQRRLHDVDPFPVEPEFVATFSFSPATIGPSPSRRRRAPSRS
jgi:hypothetical protein